jgi:diguanylate cyclase (GGDEF)-like protein
MTNTREDMRPELAATCVVSGLIFAGFVDFLSGVEIRVYPLYFLPLCLAAWRFGRIGALLAVFGATAIWIESNWAAGMHYSANHIWIMNSLSQFLAFVTVAGLIAWARGLLDREKELSSTDGLTGLANARAFYSLASLAAAACRRGGRPLTLAYIDLDNFKCVNDRYGHSVGDALLCSVGNILRNTLRTTDISARVGGDEFVVCFPETSESQAIPLLERLRVALAEVIPADECMISASIGALCWHVPPDGIDEMISTADKKMYEVKKGGKNRVEIVSIPTH